MVKQSENSLEIVITPGAGYSATGDATLTRAREAFNALGALLTDAIEPFRKKVSEAAASIDEVELRLELSLKGEGKWVVVSLGATATASVKLVWRK